MTQSDLFDVDRLLCRADVLNWLIDGVRERRPVLVVIGPPAAGKTALGNLLAAIAKSEGFTVVGPARAEDCLDDPALSANVETSSGAGRKGVNELSQTQSTAALAAAQSLPTTTTERPSVPILVVIDDLEQAPEIYPRLRRQLSQAPASGCTFVLLSRVPFETDGPTLELRPVELQDLEAAFAEIGAHLDPQASEDETKVWAAHAVEDLTMVRPLLQSLNIVRAQAGFDRYGS